MLRRVKTHLKILIILTLLCIYPVSIHSRPFVLVLSQDDLKDPSPSDPLAPDSSDSNSDWDEFGDSDSKSDDELDPGSWRSIFEPESQPDPTHDPTREDGYYSGVRKMVGAVSRGDVRMMEEGAGMIEETARGGHAHAQSMMGFLYNMGVLRERSKAKGFMYHYFASEAGNMQSKMALAYTYTRQDVCVSVSCFICLCFKFMLLLFFFFG